MNGAFRVGKSIYFRSLSVSDIENRYYEWFNDHETTTGNSHGVFPETKEKTIQFFNSLSTNKNIIHFAVCDIKTDEHIGCCSLQKIDWISRSAEMARIIGNKKYRRKGIGTEIGRILADYGFNVLNLNKIWAGNISFNIGAIKSNEKLGFVKEGVLREAIFKNGDYHDIVISSLLKKEYQKDQ
jgi:[ribosomal protein S5]-alanine N-acetyltransferase